MYSPIVMAHFEEPRHVGRLEEPDAVGLAGTPGAGPFMALYLSVSGSSIRDVRYQSYGCAPAIAAGSVLCGWLIGRSFGDCRSLTEPALVEILGGLPDDKRHCSAPAIAALQAALSRLSDMKTDAPALAE